MPATNRLLPGDAPRVKEAKKELKAMYDELNQRKLQRNQLFNWLKQNTTITNYYSNNDKMHFDIDFVGNSGIPVSYWITVDKTNKITLGNTVTVWLNKNDADGEEYWVDNYKW